MQCAFKLTKYIANAVARAIFIYQSKLALQVFHFYR